MKQSLFIITGPSGAGEDSVIEGLKDTGLTIDRVVTTTTRAMRPGESEGQPYYFRSEEEFLQGIQEDEFLEHALADRGNRYGVTRKEIEQKMQSPHLVIWKMDYKGVLTIKERMPEIPVIYVSAPIDVIRERLIARDNPEPEFLEARLAYARGWDEHKELFDHEVPNIQGKLDQTIAQVKSIIDSYQI
jgi:guanylate kinase